jgi:signal transduction histidine kinase
VVWVGLPTVKGVSASAGFFPSLGILGGNRVKAGLGAPMTLGDVTSRSGPPVLALPKRSVGPVNVGAPIRSVAGRWRHWAAAYCGVVVAMWAVAAAALLHIAWVAQLALAEVLIVGFALVYLRLRRGADQSQAFAGRRQNTFDGAPVALWEEDFSAVAAWLRALPESCTPSRLRALLAAKPATLDHGISLIRVVSVNPMAARMVDMDEGKALFGGDPADPITAEVRAAVVEQLVTIAQGQTDLEVGISGTTLSGQVIEAVLYWQAARGRGGEADYSRVVVAIADISERVAAQRRLQGVVESKDQLIASISHELRTPLTSVLGYTELLRASACDLSASEQREMLALVADAAQDISFIVEDLLTAARHESKSLRVGRVLVNVGAEVAQVVAQVHAADAHSVEVKTGSAKAWGDPARVRQVLRNLLVNALRYGGEHIRITATADGPVVRVEVSDDGDGVPAGHELRIFDAYEQAQDGSQQPGSMGLGLGISRDLTRLMGGDLTYRRPDTETIFELTLPAAEDEPGADVSGGVPEPEVGCRLAVV